MQKFNERLRLLRKEAGLSQQEFAKQIGMSKSSVNMYERGEREPGFETLECIADYFNVDMNYLLGKSDIRNTLTMNNMYNRIYNLCQEKGISVGKMCNELGISRGNLTELKMGRIKTLKAENLTKISGFFGVSVDYLLGTEKEKTPTQTGEREPDIDSAKLALFGGDGEVTDEMWEEALFAAQIIKERYRRKKENDE